MAEYIDRDKLIRHLEDDFEACGEPDSSIRPIAYGTILGLRGALSYARTLPKADVKEVRHGEYVYSSTDDKWRCSECFAERPRNNGDIPYSDIYCCYKCGARMDGGKDENV